MITYPAALTFTLIVSCIISTVARAATPLYPTVEQGRDLLGQTAEALGIGIDSLFGTPDNQGHNESYFLLRTGIRYQENGGAEWVQRLAFRLDLPATRDRWQLFVHMDDQQELVAAPSADSSSGISSEITTQISDAAERNNFLQLSDAGIYIRYLWPHQKTRWQTALDLGVEQEGDIELQPVAFLRTGKDHTWQDWTIRPTPHLFWTGNRGAGSGVSLHLSRSLSSDIYLQSTTNISYFFDEGVTYYSHAWQMSQYFSDQLRASYKVAVFSDDLASQHPDALVLSTTLRRRLHGNWLFFSVTPEDVRRADANYASDLSILFQFEAKLGNNN